MLMRQKDKPQGQCLQENKGEMAGGGGKRCSFFRKFGMVVFFVTSVFEICPFALLPRNSRHRSNESGVEVYYSGLLQ